MVNQRSPSIVERMRPLSRILRAGHAFDANTGEVHFLDFAKMQCGVSDSAPRKAGPEITQRVGVAHARPPLDRRQRARIGPFPGPVA